MNSESSQQHDQHDHRTGFRGFGHGEPARQHTGRGGRGFGPFGPRGFGPFGPMGPRGFDGQGPQRRRKGAARDAILSILGEGPQNGYGLIREISDRTSEAWTPSPGSVYPTLQQLVDEGLIEPTSDDKRTEFQLTAAGRDYVLEHADELGQLWKGATEHGEATADLHQAVGKLMGTTQQFRFQASESQRAQAVEALDDARKALYRILGE